MIPNDCVAEQHKRPGIMRTGVRIVAMSHVGGTANEMVPSIRADSRQDIRRRRPTPNGLGTRPRPNPPQESSGRTELVPRSSTTNTVDL
jgi:hypothetical protein